MHPTYRLLTATLLAATTAIVARPGTAAAEASKDPAMVDMFGSKGTKIAALTFNAVHDGEYYGNIVTYRRMKGMVPPSSKR
jgi:hypothetical protein